PPVRRRLLVPEDRALATEVLEPLEREPLDVAVRIGEVDRIRLHDRPYCAPSPSRRARRKGETVSHIEPLRREDLVALEDVWDVYDRSMGFVPRSLFTMARRPEILRAFSDLITAIWRTGTL